MADNENKIEVQIILDDGSVQRGFVKMEKQAEATAKNTEESFTDSFKNVAVATGAITAGLYLVKKAAEAAVAAIVEAEKVEAVTRQFDDLAKQAGIAADVIKNDLIKAADGLVDDTDILEKSAQAFAELGSNASKLPQVFELARKGASLYGRDTLQVFDAVNQAIATGATKPLSKLIGLNIKADEVLKAYAKSLGTVPSALSEAGKQQAFLNAVLEKGAEKFAAVDPEKNQITNNLKRASVAFGQFGEAASIAFKKMFGGAVNAGAGATAGFFDSLATTIAANSGDASAKVKQLNEQLDYFSKRLENVKESGGNLALAEKNLDGIKKQLAAIKDIQDAAKEDSLKANRLLGGGAAASQIEAEKQIEIERNKQLALDQIRGQANAAINSENQAKLANATTEEEVKRLNMAMDQAKVEQAIAEHEARKLQIKKTFEALGGENSQSYRDAMLASEQKLQADIGIIQQQGLARERLTAKQRLEGYASFFGNLATLSNSSSKEMQEIGKTSALIQATIQGYLAVQGAYTQGALIGGPPLGAAFAAAAAIASAVNIEGIRNAGGGSANFSTGGGGVTGGSLDTTGSAVTNLQPEAKPQSKIEVNIAGDVMDSDETGLRIVDLISKAFDQNGVVTSGRVI